VIDSNSIQADDLKRQRSLNKTPYKSPLKRDKSPLIEKYQDFTVKFGIIDPIRSNLVHSPSADKSKDFIIDLLGREFKMQKEAIDEAMRNGPQSLPNHLRNRSQDRKSS
jgi:hypothetical protein